MSIDWVIHPFESAYSDSLFCVVPVDMDGNVVRDLIFSDTSKPCMMSGMTFEQAVNYAWKCKREMPEVKS